MVDRSEPTGGGLMDRDGRPSFSPEDGCDPLDGLSIADEHLRRALRGEDLLVFDGAMGTQLQAHGLSQAGEMPELLNLSHAEEVCAIHADYVAAGAEVITTNTFGASARKLEGRASVSEVYRAAVACARKAGARYVAGDIGPLGTLLEPLGTLSFKEAYDLFAEQVDAVRDAGCDLVLIETMADLREAKAALLAVKERCDLPVMVTLTFGEDGRTFLGTPPEVAAEVLSSMGANAVGLNCSLGPDDLLPCADAMARRARCPLLVQPNAGLPHVEEGETVYDVSAEHFAVAMGRMLDVGVSMLGGCCGTGPAFTGKLRRLADGRVEPSARPYEPACVLASAQEAVVLPDGQTGMAVIGERINPTGKPKLKAALREGDLDYVVGEAVSQRAAGADVLDVNVGLPELDEPETLHAAVDRLQATVASPLVIDSSDPAAIEVAVRGYAGKPLVNSVSGKRESMDAVLPLVKKYGCAVIGLTLDEGGIPPTAEGRFRVAERIVREAARQGIPRQDVVIDCLVMAAATNQDEAREILRAVSMVKSRLGVRTVLGVSNVSFGLPQRGLMNGTFLAAALGAGLDMPILNPLSPRYRDTVAAFRVLNGQDAGASSYIERYAQATDPYAAPSPHGNTVPSPDVPSIGGTGDPVSREGGVGEDPVPVPTAFSDATEEVRAIVSLILSGRKGPMPEATERLLSSHDALDLVNGVFVPALDVAGERFERGDFFLPQLMASAEAVKAGFDVVKERGGEDAASGDVARTVAVATVRGDIHDIGKNIVKMLLENHGYRVIDLGRDVSSEEVVRVVRERGIRLVGLSALMTTTVRAMEETVRMVHEQAPGVAVFVGGAVLTPEYAAQIGADFYGKDAAEAARIADRYFSMQGA